MRVDLMDVAQYQVQMAMANGWQEVATFETHTEALAKKQDMDAAYPHIAFQIAEVPYNDAPVSEFTRANPGRYEAWCENAMEGEAQQEANEQAAATEYHLLHSRLFAIVAQFPDNVEGAKAANAFMESPEGQGCGVLAVEDGRIILADCADTGMGATFEWYRLTWADGATRDVWAASAARARQLGADLMERELIEHGDIVLCIPTGA